MSFTDTEKHWLWGCAAATAASRSDVNVAMPHLRGKWSPTNAILRILEPSSMRQSLHSSRPALLCTRVCAPTANVPPEREGVSSGNVDPVLRAWFSRHPDLPIVIATHNLAFARRCHRVLRLRRGHVEEVAPESLRRESRFRQKVSRLWTFSGAVRTNGRTGSATGLQVVVAMLQRNGSRVRSIMNQSP